MSTATPMEYFRLFFETGQAILSAFSQQETLDQLVKRSAEALAVRGCSLRLIDERSGRLELVAAFGLSQTYLDKGPLTADRSIPEVLQGQPVCIADARNDARIQYPEALRAEGIVTLLSVPVASGERIIGVLRLYTDAPRSFSPEEIEFVSALAELGGLAIANARLYEAQGERLTQRLREVGIEHSVPVGRLDQRLACFALQPLDAERSLAYFRALHQVTRAILATLDSAEVMQLILAQLQELTEVKGCALRLVNQTSGELELLAARGLSDAFLHKGTPHLDRSIRDTLEGTPVLIEDTRSDARLEYPDETVAEGIVAILSVPIVARERIIGVMRLYAGENKAFSREEVSFVCALAEIAGIAIMNARLYEQTSYDLSFWDTTLKYLG